jgi:5-formyltetrahydrofolate cyclo-ligase
MDAMIKPLLRRQLQERRDNISEATRTVFSRVIVERLIQAIDWSEVQRAHCYIPLARRSEVDIWALLHYLWRRQPTIEIAVPGPLQSGRPIAYAINAQTMWRKTTGIPSPIEPEPVTDNSFDVVIVPCLGFDHDHYRLGYGSGYYDLFLSTQPHAKLIGVAFWAGYVAKGLPREKHDVALGQIVTEERVL